MPSGDLAAVLRPRGYLAAVLRKWLRVRVMVFNATFNNISVILLQLGLYLGGNWSTQRKPLTCRKSLTNFIT
jgi:hypothetical protein